MYIRHVRQYTLDMASIRGTAMLSATHEHEANALPPLRQTELFTPFSSTHALFILFISLSKQTHICMYMGVGL